MNEVFKKRSLFFLFAIFLVIGVVGTAWILESPAREELFGDTGKITDLLNGGITSWSPNYMLGCSMVVHLSTALAVALASFFFTLLGPLLGIFAAFKLLIILFVIASCYTMFLFVKKLTGNTLMASVAALMMVALPSLNVTIGIYEHWTIGLCFVFVPLILRGLLTVAEKNSPREIVVLGLAAAAVSLSYIKIAVVISPVLLLWILEMMRLHPKKRVSILLRYGMSAAIAFFTSILILLPALREFGFAAGLLLDPLEAWQHHYAFKSALQWVDLWGFFMNGAGPDITCDASMFAIGFIPLLVISLGLGLTSLQEWRHTAIGRWFLILVACWLVSINLAAGLDGIFLGHWNLLKISKFMFDLSIPLLWLALSWLVWMVFQTAHQLIGGTWKGALAITLVFLFFPLFRLVQVLPLFKDIRAVECFWSIGGFCTLAAAVGMVIVPIFTQLIPKRFFKTALVIAGFLFFAELYPIHSAYWTRGLPSEIFTQYDQALTFLKTAPLPGRVHPLCTRYFYLTIPEETGHGLSTETLLRHFQLKWVRYFENAGNANVDTLKSYLNLAGVSYIFIDKEDPLIPKQTQNFYRSCYPLVFENQFFVILENQNSLYPAFLARNFVALPPQSYSMAAAAFQLAPMNLLTVELPQVDQGMLGFAGMSKGNNQIELVPAYREHAGAPFLRVPLVAPRLDNYNQMIYHVPPTVSGWLTLTEAYHPDWRATIDGERAPTYRAETALLSVYIPIGSSEIIFKFVPPFWYSLTLYMGILSWILALGAFFFLSSRWASPAWKLWWLGQQEE